MVGEVRMSKEGKVRRSIVGEMIGGELWEGRRSRRNEGV